MNKVNFTLSRSVSVACCHGGMYRHEERDSAFTFQIHSDSSMTRKKLIIQYVFHH